MSAKGVLKDTDNGFKALAGRLKSFGSGKVLSVGVHAGEGGTAHGNATLLEIATIHEYGLGNNPQRSFIRDWADETEAAHREALKKIGIQVLKGTYTIDVGLSRLGALFQGEVQARISSGIAPGLSAATLAKKTVGGKVGNVPLINTGQLRSAITWRVSNASG